MDAYLTADGLARIYHVPRGTIYRWASEDSWRRTRTRPTRYHTGDADTSYHKRHTKPATSLDTQAEQGRSLGCSLSRSVPSALRGALPCQAVIMFGIAAIVAFAVALILQLASAGRGVLLTAATFVIIGLLCLSVHVVTGWWPSRGA